MIKHLYKVFFLIILLWTQNTTAQNSAPSTQKDYDTADVNSTVNVNAADGLLSNDTDIDGDTLTIINFIVNNTTYAAGDNADVRNNSNGIIGNITINDDGSYVFTNNQTTQYDDDIEIVYIVSDSQTVSYEVLDFTIQETTDLIEVDYVVSCNQGYNTDDEYQIYYQLSISNTSTAKDLHTNSLIENLNFTNNLNAIFGNSCVNTIDVMGVFYNNPQDYINDPYDEDFDNDSINDNYLDGTSSSIFTTDAINNSILYPRQTLTLIFCVNVDASCAGNNVDFDNIYTVSSNKGSDSNSLEITDFSSSEAIVTAAIHLPEADSEPSVSEPEINTDSTFDYTTRIIITNEGNAAAEDVNYNMGLSQFISALGTFDSLTITQVSGPAVTTNDGVFDGVTNTLLLANGNNLAAGQTIILDVYILTQQITYKGEIPFNQMTTSLSQGASDGYNEIPLKNELSYVLWSDSTGDYVDRYYNSNDSTTPASSTSQCTCESSSVNFTYSITSSTELDITNVDTTPNGILEHEEIYFEITIENTSPAVQIEHLQITEDLISTCDNDTILEFTSTPTITSSDAFENPTLNTSFNGENNTNLFIGTDGVLEEGQSITVEFTILVKEDCVYTNTANFTYTDPTQTISGGSSASDSFEAFTDTDGDGIYNTTDIDDDNDTILDVTEYNGTNPLDDADNDDIPDYRDPDFGVDNNNDGIIDVFDFDRDGVPNHFDIDTDNDGIYDLVEVNNQSTSQDNDGIAETNFSDVGNNGLHNTVENSDSVNTTINYIIPNSDADTLNNFIDIDSDNDGIVDNIEAQTSDNYIAPSGTVNAFGLDSRAYSSGITPIDNDGDTIADYIDTNSDDDIWNDAIEGWDFNSDGTPDTVFSNIDIDNDGLDDAYDNDNTTVNPTNGQTPDSFPDVDNPDNPEKDWREIIAISITMLNANAIEGNNLEFPINLIRKFNGDPIESASDISIDFTTTDGTENADEYNIAYTPYDYIQVSSANFTISAYNENATYSITSIDDRIYELDELFTLNGSVTSDNTYTTEISATGTILDNEPPPSISMDTASAEEGDDLIHTITISHPSSTPIIINVNTSDDQALSPGDYTAITETLEIEDTIDENDSNTQVSFSISTLTDNTNELDPELLNVIGTVSTNNVGAEDLTKFGVIIDIDPDPTIFITDSEVVEGNKLNFTISLLNADDELMLNYLPIILNIETLDDTAIGTEDYQPLNIPVTIPAYTSSVERSVTTIDDKLNEDTEHVTIYGQITSLGVSNSNNFVTATGSIKDNDIPNLFSPNDDGLSDVFEIAGMNEYPNFTIKIFDRWGSQVYDYSNDGRINPIWWDGTNNGKSVPEGVYYYTLEYNDNETDPKTNFIQIVR